MVEGGEVLLMSVGASLIVQSWHLAYELDVWDFFGGVQKSEGDMVVLGGEDLRSQGVYLLIRY